MRNEIMETFKMEAFDYVQYALRRYHNHQLNCCLYMEGRIDETILQNAVVASFQDLPQLCSRFYKGAFRRGQEWPPFSIETIEGEAKREEIMAFFVNTVLIEESYQVKVKVFRGRKKDAVAIVANHMLLDGIAMKQYIYLLCELYNAQVSETKVKKRYIGLARDISWVSKEKALRRPHSRKPERERIDIKGGGEPCFLTERIPREKFALIKAYAKSKEVTVNDFFITAYYKAVQKVFSYPLQTICCAADLRRYHKSPCGLSNQTGNMFCTIRGGTEQTFEELLQEVHKQMDQEKANGCCLTQIKKLNRVYSCLPRIVAMRLIDESVTNPKVALSNLGIVEQEKLVFGGVKTEDCFLSGAIKNAPNLQVSVCTYQDEVTMGINLFLSKEERIRITYFLQVLYVTMMEVIIP